MWPQVNSQTEREMPVVIAEELPSVFDSHFLLDRTAGELFKIHKGHSVEDLIMFSEKDKSARPGVRVQLEGGIVVYSKPETYPAVNFVMQVVWQSEFILDIYWDSTSEKRKF